MHYFSSLYFLIRELLKYLKLEYESHSILSGKESLNSHLQSRRLVRQTLEINCL